MEQLKTAESTTKLLRSKDISSNEAADISYRLLDGSLDVFLLNSHHFVFDLICDRMNDLTGKLFKTWKFQPSLWTLWHHVWKLMENSPSDRKARTNSFRKVKFVQVVTAVLDEDTKENRTELLSAMFECVSIILDGGFIDVEEFSATGLFASYVKRLNHISPITLLAPIDSWTKSVLTIFTLPKHSSSYKPTKKSSARYFSEVLPQILHFLIHNQVSLDPASSYVLIDSANKAALFENDPNATSLISHTDDFLASKPKATLSAVELYFKIIIEHLAAKNIKACEAVYLKITENSDFAICAELLLAVLGKVNRSLSTELFTRIYENSQAQKSIPWRLVGYLVRLDPTLALAKANEIVQNSKDLELADIDILADDLAHGFIKARDLTMFIDTVYPQAVKSNKAWASEKVVNTLSQTIEQLSANQIISLTNRFLDSSEEPVIILLLRGLLLCPTSKQIAVKPIIESTSLIHSDWPQATFCLLSLYGDEILNKHHTIATQVLEKKQKQKHDYYVLFRTMELTLDFLYLTKDLLQAAFKDFSNETFENFTLRWIVLLEVQKECFTLYLEELFSRFSADQIASLLESNQNIIFELPILLKSLSSHLEQEPLETRNTIISVIPQAVYRRFFSNFTNILVTESMSLTETREILLHVLDQPTLSSTIEKDFDLLIQFFRYSLSEVSQKIASKIWDTHVHHYKDQTSQKYVLKGLDYLSKNLKGSEDPSILGLCHIMLSGPKPNELTFETAYSDVCEKFINQALTRKELSQASLQVLADLPPQLCSKFKNALLEVAKRTDAFETSFETKVLLFKIVSKACDGLLKDAFFVISLHIALRASNCPAGSTEPLRDSLEEYIGTLLPETLSILTDNIVKSATSCEAEFFMILIDVLLLMCGQCNKENKDFGARTLVKTILLMLSRLELLNDATLLLRFLKLLSRMLTLQTWLFSQYTIELTLNFCGLVIKQVGSSESLFISTIDVTAQIILFHRFRLNSRYHLVLSIATQMIYQVSHPELSVAAANMLSRFLISLCEPSSQASTKESDSLTSQAALYKKVLRKYAYVLLLNYVDAQLQHSISSEKTEALIPGIFSIFGLLSKTELQLVSQLLDSQSRYYYRTLYNRFKEQGKWRDL